MAYLSDAAQGFIESFSKQPEDEKRTRSATVSYIDNEGTIWVRFIGADADTPVVQSSATVNPGDFVEVVTENGRARIYGNVSNPSAQIDYADTINANALQALNDAQTASNAAASAQRSADSAAGAAANAQQSADDAATAAGAAQESAATANANANQAIADAAAAYTAAGNAQTSANQAASAASNAQTSANTAGAAANSALTQLSVVEDVVGVLSWISEHATYQASTDTSVVPGKFYFTRSGSGTEADPYVYSIVQNPTGNPSTSEYYEVDDIDEAVSNYVMSHIALDNDGLWIVNDASSYKALFSSDGLKVFDASGDLVATFGESIEFSSSRPQTIGGEDSYITFYDSDDDGEPDSIMIGGTKVSINAVVTASGETMSLSNMLTLLGETASAADDAKRTATDYLTFTNGELTIGTSNSDIRSVLTNVKFSFKTDSGDIAYFGLNNDDIWEMHIDNAFVDDMLRFGDYAWIKRQNGNMSIKWLGA